MTDIEFFQTYENSPIINIDDIKDFYKITLIEARSKAYKLIEDKRLIHLSRENYVLSSFVKNEPKVAVINLDIINSTKIKDFDNILSEKLSLINDTLNNNYSIKFKCVACRGDEIQLFIEETDKLVDIFIMIISTLYPFKIRYSISIGYHFNEIKRNPWNMNGPLFWNARLGLDEVEDSKDYNGRIITGNHKIDIINNDIIELLNKSLTNITERQWRAIRLSYIGLNDKDASKDMSITLKSYKALIDRSNIKSIQKSYEVMKDLSLIKDGVI